MSATKDISDGHHTFGELYEHRHALFAALASAWSESAWRSREHGDGKPMFDDSFIAGIDLPTGQITYHLPKSWWPLFDFAETRPDSGPYDGHTSRTVVARLRELVEWMELP